MRSLRKFRGNLYIVERLLDLVFENGKFLHGTLEFSIPTPEFGSILQNSASFFFFVDARYCSVPGTT